MSAAETKVQRVARQIADLAQEAGVQVLAIVEEEGPGGERRQIISAWAAPGARVALAARLYGAEREMHERWVAGIIREARESARGNRP